jgi:hypothetical protein
MIITNICPLVTTSQRQEDRCAEVGTGLWETRKFFQRSCATVLLVRSKTLAIWRNLIYTRLCVLCSSQFLNCGSRPLRGDWRECSVAKGPMVVLKTTLKFEYA